jgi:hypothetical protein
MHPATQLYPPRGRDRHGSGTGERAQPQQPQVPDGSFRVESCRVVLSTSLSECDPKPPCGGRITQVATSRPRFGRVDPNERESGVGPRARPKSTSTFRCPDWLFYESLAGFYLAAGVNRSVVVSTTMVSRWFSDTGTDRKLWKSALNPLRLLRLFNLKGTARSPNAKGSDLLELGSDEGEHGLGWRLGRRCAHEALSHCREDGLSEI